MGIDDLTPAEQRVWQAFGRGEGVDFRSGDGDRAQDGASWGPERTVRAAVLRALLVEAPAQEGEISGLKLAGARITGRLNLAYGTVDQAVRLRSCHFEHAPQLYGAQIRALVLSNSVLPGLSAATLRVDGVLRLTGCQVSGPVLLQGSAVAGAVFLDNACLGDPLDAENLHEPILQLNHAEIGTDVWAENLVAYGQVRLDAATVRGQVNLEAASLHDPGGVAMRAEALSVGTDLRAVRLLADGEVNLSGARIPRRLDLGHARLSNPEGMALNVATSVVGELWLAEAVPIQGSADLNRAQLDVLHALPTVWPEQVSIDDLKYRMLAPHLPAGQRLPLLDRDGGRYLPHTFEQLALAYRAAGDDDAARAVQLAKLRRLRRSLPRHVRAWGYVQDATVGYGFRPGRAAAWLLVLLLVGALSFGVSRPRAVNADEAPDFNAFVYTVDLLLPVVDFGQQGAFNPHGWHQWYAYLLIASGWLFATTIAAGVTRTLSRQ
ncbi:membrane-associated oxidoreductase [Streptomycetaceae bacterium NBC_01309]